MADLSNYRCPVCKSRDPYRYMDCDYAGCTDGRDPPARNKPPKDYEELDDDDVYGLRLRTVLAIVGLSILGFGGAYRILYHWATGHWF